MRAGKILGLLVGVGVCAITLPARAQVDAGSENASLFGLVDQNSAGINSPGVACAPTATYNSFVYLNNAFPSAGLGALLGTAGGGKSAAANAINTLESDIPGFSPTSGTSGGSALATGKTTYINNAGLSNQISVESLGNNGMLAPNTAARFIASQLAMGQDVEMGFLWTNSAGATQGGGHVVTVTSINYNETTQTGTMSIVDPWDGVALSGNLTVANSELLLGYTGGGAGTGGADGHDPDNTASAGFGAMSFVTAESFVGSAPEPATVGVIAISALLMVRRRRLYN